MHCTYFCLSLHFGNCKLFTCIILTFSTLASPQICSVLGESPPKSVNIPPAGQQALIFFFSNMLLPVSRLWPTTLATVSAGGSSDRRRMESLRGSLIRTFTPERRFISVHYEFNDSSYSLRWIPAFLPDALKLSSCFWLTLQAPLMEAYWCVADFIDFSRIQS